MILIKQSLLTEEILIDLVIDKIKTNKLNKYVDEIIIAENNNDSTNFLAGYSLDTKQILINYKFMINNIKENSENNFEANLMLNYIINHEIIHIKQARILKSIFPSIEKSILKDDLKVMKDYYYYYTKNHNYFPSEYNAIVVGYLETFKEYTSELYLDNLLQYIDDYYKNNRLLHFYKDVNALKKYEDLINNNLEDKKRILIGLPTKENHNKIIQKLI